jgi:hypothetical protein
MDGIERALAIVQGEAAAARMLGAMALRLAVEQTASPAETVALLSRITEAALSGAGSQPESEIQATVRETARHRIADELSAIAAGLQRQG